MSEFEQSRSVWRRKRALECLLRQLDTVTYSLFDGFSRDPAESPTLDEMRTALNLYGQHLSKEYRGELDTCLGSGTERSGAEAYAALRSAVNKQMEACTAALDELPASVDKARGYLMAFTDVGQFDSAQDYAALLAVETGTKPRAVSRLVSEWKSEYRRFLADRHKAHTIVEYAGPRPELEYDPSSGFGRRGANESHVFWVSDDFQWELDAHLYYRVMERFQIGEFPEMTREIEGSFATICASVALSTSPWAAPPQVGLYWLSKSRLVSARIRSYIDIALTELANVTDRTRSWWFETDSTLVKAGQKWSIFSTALAAVILLRMGREEWQRLRAKDSVRWMAKHQMESGAWQHQSIQWTEDPEDSELVRYTREDDLWTTLLVAEAIEMSGLAGYEHTLSRAHDWILRQQRSDGTWSIDGLADALSTFLCVECLQGNLPGEGTLDPYLELARGLLQRSQELMVQDNTVSRQMAIMAAFQGLEAFLYACLSHPSVKVSIWKDSANTVGVRHALSSLQNHLQNTKVINRGSNMSYKAEVERLAYWRDQIVHKAAMIEASEAVRLVGACVRFADEYATIIFGHHLVL